MGQSLAALTMQLGALRNVVAGADGKVRDGPECASGECCRMYSYLLQRACLKNLAWTPPSGAHVDGFTQQTGSTLPGRRPGFGTASQSLETTLFDWRGVARIHRYGGQPGRGGAAGALQMRGRIELRIEDHGTGVVEIDNGEGPRSCGWAPEWWRRRERAAELGGKIMGTLLDRRRSRSVYPRDCWLHRCGGYFESLR